MKCQYCNNKAEWVENKEIYGRNYGNSYMIWLCRPCDAYVGCHKNTRNSLGTLANKELREIRKKAKGRFITRFMDGDWNDKDKKKRAYKIIRNLFGYKFHFGSSTVEDCQRIINFIDSL